MSAPLSKLEKLKRAIARQEGFYVQGSLAQRNHNPGNLRRWQGYPTVKGFAVFPTDEVGFEKMEKNLRTYCKRWPQITLREAIAKWAPASDGNAPAIYAANVAKAVGVPLDTPLKDLLA